MLVLLCCIISFFVHVLWQALCHWFLFSSHAECTTITRSLGCYSVMYLVLRLSMSMCMIGFSSLSFFLMLCVGYNDDEVSYCELSGPLFSVIFLTSAMHDSATVYHGIFNISSNSCDEIQEARDVLLYSEGFELAFEQPEPNLCKID